MSKETSKTDENLKREILEGFEANLAGFLEKTGLSEDELADLLTLKFNGVSPRGFKTKEEIQV